MELSTEGLLGGEPEAGDEGDLMRGLVAPDASMLVLLFESTTETQTQQFPGVPGSTV